MSLAVPFNGSHSVPIASPTMSVSYEPSDPFLKKQTIILIIWTRLVFFALLCVFYFWVTRKMKSSRARRVVHPFPPPEGAIAEEVFGL
nr:hypothetical protein CFP56_66307 [Quercus suber]